MSRVQDRVEHHGKWRIRAIYSGKWWRERGKKSLLAIPHVFTLLNLAFGVFSIMLTMRGEFEKASLCVIGSLVADGLDGRLARLFKADGEFGKELDSLADVVAFGTAPAILLYQMVLKDFGYVGMAFAVIFPMCGALRLARFNIIKTSGFFQGVPITAAGTLLSCLAFYTMQEVKMPVKPLFPAVVLILAYLMVSTIPYPDFKKRPKTGTRIAMAPIVGPFLVVLAVLAASGWNPWSLVLLPLTVYVTLGPWLLVIKQWAERVQPWLAGDGRR
ncbi:MAG TPA: CDP-diacylglycerol--serine O-phosphatidyltransferase [Symbiobacteriaceae bacterium]|nr:CDP-diacylglycerol--serine O-phosphatidyltransferase [Symbiobacteriaceae bacterium]